MIKGTTSTGFEFEVNENRLNNMEFIDTLVELESIDDDNAGQALTCVSKLINCIFTKEQKKKLYDHVRAKDGTVPIEAVQNEVMEVIHFDGNEELKNS